MGPDVDFTEDHAFRDESDDPSPRLLFDTPITSISDRGYLLGRGDAFWTGHIEEENSIICERCGRPLSPFKEHFYRVCEICENELDLDNDTPETRSN